jgi:hypothetical protein
MKIPSQESRRSALPGWGSGACSNRYALGPGGPSYGKSYFLRELCEGAGLHHRAEFLSWRSSGCAIPDEWPVAAQLRHRLRLVNAGHLECFAVASGGLAVAFRQGGVLLSGRDP